VTRYIVSALSSNATRPYGEHIRIFCDENDGPFFAGFPVPIGTALCGEMLVGGWDTKLPLPGAGPAPVTVCADCRNAYLAVVRPPKPAPPPKPPKLPKPPKAPRVRRYHGETTHDDTAVGLAGLVAWTDGSGTMQDSPAAVGVIVALDGVVVVEASEHIGLGTNNVAEVRAIGRALALGFAVGGGRGPLIIFSDSEFAMGAVCRGSSWEISESRNPDLRTLVLQVRNEVARWRDLTFQHVKGHSGNYGNERCDWLAGRARKAHIAAVTAAASPVEEQDQEGPDTW